MLKLLTFFLQCWIFLFIFSDVNFLDQGEYTCYAENKLGTAEAVGSLTVKGNFIIFLVFSPEIEFYLGPVLSHSIKLSVKFILISVIFINMNLLL